MKLKLGDKAYGIYFPHTYQGISFPDDMMNYIGQEGEVTDISVKTEGTRVCLEFNNGVTYYYPEDLLTTLPNVPSLDSEVKGFVSDDGETWFEETVIGKFSDNSVITKDLIKWSHFKFTKDEDKKA